MKRPGSDDLSAMNPTGRFSDRAADYVKYRPSYPAAAIEACLEDVDRTTAVIADIGAGTGISARLLADALGPGSRGRIIAIEPNTPMREAADPHPKVEWRAATAEATGLPDAGVDAIVCATAFHWFKPAPTLGEFHRVLRPGGAVHLMWNERNNADPCTNAYSVAIRRASGEHAAEKKATQQEFLRDHPGFSGFRHRVFPNAQRLDFDGLLGRARSASYIPTSGPAWERLVDDFREMHERFADARGEIAIVYDTDLYSARRCDAAGAR